MDNTSNAKQKAIKKKYKRKVIEQPSINLLDNPSFINITNTTIQDLSQSQISHVSFQQSNCTLVSIIHDIQYTNKYKKCAQSIEQGQNIKSLKKYFKKSYEKVKNLQVLHSLEKPQIVFDYRSQNIEKRVSLKQLLKVDKQFGKKQKDIILQIFDKLYERVGEQFHKLLLIVDKLSEKHRVQLKINNKSTSPLLYYQLSQKHINFTYFDKYMKIFEFTSKMIEDIELQKSLMNIWCKFQRSTEKIKGQSNIQIDQYQIESQEQHNNYKQDIKQIKEKIDAILNTDITQFQDELYQLEMAQDQLKKKDFYKVKGELERVSQEIYQKNKNLQNFKNIQKRVQEEMKGHFSEAYRYRNLLKKMIIARSQLQSKLPIVSRKEEILKALTQDNLIILEGQTGSGKSTQLPQILCEYYNFFDKNPKNLLPILITQPRRLATRTVSQRVASEMQQKIGGFVDYAATRHKQISKQAKIIFKLDAIVLDQLTVDRSLSKYCCLIIDEAHERTISIDVILGLIKQLLQKRKDFKVIVTSASLDGKLLQEYFNKKLIKISGRLYPVQIIYKSINHQQDIIRKIQSVLKKDILISSSELRPQYLGDILIFCSGLEEIHTLCTIFERFLNPRVFKVYGLHGRVSIAEQKSIFLKTKQHKLIFASRIAQTSITINGVTVVIDAGYDIQLVYDQKNRVSTRKLMSISQSSAKQRAGRAGRTQKGFCFRLYSQAEYKQLRQNKTPQIDNMALDTLVLRLKSLNIQQIFKFPYIKRPSQYGLMNSVQTLQMIGGLDFSGKITAIGNLLLQLRIQPFLGRAIVEAIICSYVVEGTEFTNKRSFSQWPQRQKQKLKWIKEDIVQILGMIIYSSNLFFISQKTKDHLDLVKFNNYANQKGDFFYLRNIYNQFMNNSTKTKQHLHKWLKQRYLNKKVLFQAKQLIEQVKMTIKLFKVDLKDKSTEQLVNNIKMRMLQCKNADDILLSCLLMSFCVNLSIYSDDPNIGYTLILQKKPIKIYGTSTLSLQGISPKYIVCYDLKANNKGITYCSIAHEIDYKFFKNIVSDTVFDKLNLKQSQKINPFYDSLQFNLPSIVLQEINQQYINRENNSKSIYQYISIMTNQQTNVMKISFLKGLTVKEVNPSYTNKNIKEIIQQMIYGKIIDKKHSIMKFHFMSNIYIEMSHGFQIKSVYFTNFQVQFIVTAEKNRLVQLGLIFQRIDNKYIGDNKEKLKLSTVNQEEYKTIKSYLDQNFFFYQEVKIEMKGNSLNSKIYMHFYDGKLNKDKILPFFMLYNRQNAEKVQQYCQILSKIRKSQGVKSQQQKYRYLNILSKCRFKVSKNKNGIQCYNSDIDSFILKQTLEHLIVYGIIPFNFKMPTSIRQFRQIDAKFKLYDEAQWQKQIKIKFQQRGYKNLSIKVYANQQKHNNGNEGKQLTAQISSQKIQILDKLMMEFNGKQNIVGRGQIHFRYNYQNFIIKINKKLFLALKDEFDYLKDKFENNIAQLKIQANQRIIGKISSVYLSCRSPIKQKLFEPSQKIKYLFTPYIIRLNQNQFNFLCYSSEGDRFMSNLQDQKNYKIYFGFDKKKTILKLYCQSQQQYQQIQNRVFLIFQSLNISSAIISYIGKGLKNVQNVLQNYRQKIQQKNKKYKNHRYYLQYKIFFKNRSIKIQGDFQSLQIIKNEIKSLVNQAPGNCFICFKNTQKPYKLINCDHVFCFKCLGDYIQDYKKEQNLEQSISCPEENCKQLINCHDIRSILSTEEYQSLVHKKIIAFVKNNQNQYIFCPTNGCEQIFEKKQLKNKHNFSCHICGKWFCAKCLQPHQYFTCQQWQVKLVKGQLAKFGFKKCKCGAVLQKQNKQKLIKCKVCKQSLCWVCVKGWPKEKDCLSHIKNCKAK